MNIKPIGDRVLVHFKTEEKTQSGILLAKAAQKKPEICIIIAAGNGIKNKDLHIGTQIIVHRYSGTDIDCDGIKASIIKESDILAIVHN